MSSILEGALGNLLGGMLLAALFFFLKEKVFSFKEVSGCWRATHETLRSAYNPYYGMKVVYTAMLFRSGSNIHGSLEKIYEVAGGKSKEYTGSERTRGIIEGTYEKNVFSSDRLLLHVTEEGAERISSTYLCVVVKNKYSIEGMFETFAADSSGSATWERVN